MISNNNAILDAEKFFALPFSNYIYTFEEYNPIYLFTNEQLSEILKNSNLSGKLLSVTASGDQVLNAILMGAKDVQMFDLNKFAKYFVNLKIEALKNLSYEEFLKLYNIKKEKKHLVYNALSPSLNKEMLLKVYEKMDDSYALFFKKLLSLSFFEEDTNYSDYYMHVFNPENNKYLDEEQYYKVQKLLPSVKINDYIDSDIFDLKEHVQKYKFSTMLFSNISSYFYSEDLPCYFSLLHSLEENLTDGGIMQIGYGKKDSTLHGTAPLNRRFVLEHKDKITEVNSEDKIITYYHK